MDTIAHVGRWRGSGSAPSTMTILKAASESALRISMTPVDGDLVRLTFAMIFAELARLQSEKSKSRGTLLWIGAGLWFLSFFGHVFGWLPL